MELVQVAMGADWIWLQKIPIFLFLPLAGFASILGALVITELIMKWLELAFGYKESG